MSVLLMTRRAGGAAAAGGGGGGSITLLDDSNNAVAFAVSPMRGEFPDGSLRSVGIQFTATLTNGAANSRTYTAVVNGESVPIHVWRFDGNSGSVLVSGGLPLKPSAVTPAILPVGGPSWDEMVYDSTLISGVVDPYLRAGSQNRAVFIPTGSQYWCDTFVALTPLKPEADEVADSAKTFFRTSSGTASTLGEWAAYNDANYPGAGTGAATYEHVHGFLASSIRADSAAKKMAFYERFYTGLRNQMNGYYLPGASADTPNGNVVARVGQGADSTLPSTGQGGLTAEWNSGVAMGWASGYYMTAWKQPWRMTAFYQSAQGGGNTTYAAAKSMVSPEYLPRFNVSLRMLPCFTGYVLDATMQVGNGDFGYGAGRNNTTASFENELVWYLDALEEFKFTTANYGAYINGVVGMRPTADEDGGLAGGAGKFPNFQLSVVARGLAFYYANIKNDSRIPTWMQTLADFIIGQSVDETTHYSMPYQQDANPTGVARESYYLSFFSELFGWVYAYTGNATYKTWALRAANERELRQPSPFITNVKAYGEYFGGHLQSAKFYIDGGSIRHIAGAHPTAIVNPPTYTS